MTLAEAQVVRWQNKYGRDPTDQQRSWLLHWLVNKIRTDIAMIMGIKLNAQVIIMMIKNLQNMLSVPVHGKSLPPTGARRRMELEYPACKAGDRHHTFFERISLAGI
jgi:hypothetical protein